MGSRVATQAKLESEIVEGYLNFTQTIIMRNHHTSSSLILCFLLTLATHHQLESKSFPVREVEIIESELGFDHANAQQGVLVDIFSGSIEVVGYDGDTVGIRIKRTIEARSEDALQTAKDEVHLDIDSADNFVRIFEEAPYRNDSGRIDYRGDRYYGFSNSFEVSLMVPKRCSLILQMVNKGDVVVAETDGEFQVSNVNGKVIMQHIGGHGKATSVNGRVEVGFQDNPTEDCFFKTINGDIKVEFQPTLSADVLVKTFNGNAYTDFETKSIPTDRWNELRSVKKLEKKNGFYSYKTSGFSGVRIGEGGPSLRFDTLNGDVRIVERKDAEELVAL